MTLTTKTKNTILLGTFLLLGAVLRFYKADVQSIWLDEVFSMIHSNPDKSFSEIYTFIKAYDPHPPLYYFLLHIFVKIFGYSTLHARLFSGIIGVAGIYYIYKLAKELFTARVGLIAAALLAVNYFHIYYSQEVRMYTLLLLTTVVSFYYLVRFIKSPSLKTAVFYGVAASLMIYSQFFGLFTLAAQYLILLLFVVKPYNIKWTKFLGFSFLSGVVTLLLYIPAIPIFLQTTKATSTWVLPPGPDAFTVLFKEFFGAAEIIIWLALLGVILYFARLGRLKQVNVNAGIDPVKQTAAFSFVVLFTWIFITVIIPYTLSFIKLPMIINRYFINILPAVIIIIAAGIHYLKNTIVQTIVVASFVVCSVTDLVYVKDYYNKVTKTQFREITNKIKERNIRGAKVVTFWGWILPYFFEDTPYIRVQGYGFPEFLGEMRNGKKPLEAFWYLDGNARPYALSPEDEAYLNENFVLREKYEFNDTWTRFYVPKAQQYLPSQPYMDAPVVPVLYKAGEYNVKINTRQLPLQVQDDEPAYIKVKFNGREIGNFYLEKNTDKSIEIPFSLDADEKGVIQLVYADKRFEYAYSRYSSVYLKKIITKQ